MFAHKHRPRAPVFTVVMAALSYSTNRAGMFLSHVQKRMFVLVGRVITVYCFTFGATVFSIQWNYFIITLLMLVDCDVVLIVTFFFLMFLKLRKICPRLNFLFLVFVFSFLLHFLVLLFFMQLFSFTHISVHRSLKSRCMSLGQNQQATPFQQVRQRSGTTVRMRVN